MFRITTALTLAILAGCDPTADDKDNNSAPPDADADGLTDDEEADLRTDPENVDSDGDTISDYDEVDGLGTDPLSVDTDGDSYQDNWEQTEGTDPTDANSVIYKGGWPYNPDKAQYEGRTWDDAGNNEGDPLAYFTFLDSNGDMVDIYDFADQGKPIMIDIAAMWCQPCQGISKWLAGISDPYHWQDTAPHIRDAVQNGDVYWVTILGDDMGNSADNVYTTGDVDADELGQWEDTWPNPAVPLMADDQSNGDEYQGYAQGSAVTALLENAWPTTILFNEDLTVMVGPGPGNNFYAPIFELEDMLANGEL